MTVKNTIKCYWNLAKDINVEAFEMYKLAK